MKKYNMEAFAKIYKANYPKIKYYIQKKVNNDESIADDLTSITFEKALNNIQNFRWQGISISAWLYKIANNTVIDYYRKQNTYSSTHNFTHDNISDTKDLVENNLLRYDSENRIKLIINSLDKREREIVLLKFYEGYTNKAISEKLDISESNVGTILYRTIKKLRGSNSLKGNI